MGRQRWLAQFLLDGEGLLEQFLCNKRLVILEQEGSLGLQCSGEGAVRFAAGTVETGDVTEEPGDQEEEGDGADGTAGDHRRAVALHPLGDRLAEGVVRRLDQVPREVAIEFVAKGDGARVAFLPVMGERLLATGGEICGDLPSCSGGEGGAGRASGFPGRRSSRR